MEKKNVFLILSLLVLFMLISVIIAENETEFHFKGPGYVEGVVQVAFFESSSFEDISNFLQKYNVTLTNIHGNADVIIRINESINEILTKEISYYMDGNKVRIVYIKVDGGEKDNSNDEENYANMFKEEKIIYQSNIVTLAEGGLNAPDVQQNDEISQKTITYSIFGIILLVIILYLIFRKKE